MADTPVGWKNISVFLDDTSEGGRIGDHAAALARRFEAHLIGIHSIEGIPGERPADSFVRGTEAIDAVVARHREAERIRDAALARLVAGLGEKHDVATEVRMIRWGQGEEETLMNSLHCDLVILGHPKSHGLSEWWTAERLLMESGVPVLIVPDRWEGEIIGRKVLVAWNASREARRAVADAMPILSTARSVTVLVVDDASTPQNYGEEPGADIATLLARHCNDVDLLQVDADGASVAEVICSCAAEQGADLIVIGAYSHARSAEMIFGGTTRTLLARLPVPALVSR